MKVLSPRVHGYLDYAVVALFLLAPVLFELRGTPATLCYILALAHAGMTLLTAFPLGVAKIIPFPVHGGVEVAVSVLLLASPWIFGFPAIEAARNFFLASGALVGLVWLLTDYKSVAAVTGPRAPYAQPRRSYS